MSNATTVETMLVLGSRIVLLGMVVTFLARNIQCANSCEMQKSTERAYGWLATIIAVAGLFVPMMAAFVALVFAGVFYGGGLHDTQTQATYSKATPRRNHAVGGASRKQSRRHRREAASVARIDDFKI